MRGFHPKRPPAHVKGPKMKEGKEERNPAPPKRQMPLTPATQVCIDMCACIPSGGIQPLGLPLHLTCAFRCNPLSLLGQVQ